MRLVLLAALALVAAGCGTAAPPTPVAPHDAGRSVGGRGAEQSPAAALPPLGTVPGSVRPGVRGSVHVSTAGSRPRRIAVAGRSAATPVAHLVVPSRSIDARVLPVRFAGARLRIPASIAEVGYWVDGARLSDAVGTTVLVGHVSDDHDRPGVLGRLGGVRVGAEVQVAPARGVVRRFVVTRVRTYAKEVLPRSVFDQSGPHRLVLITCTHRVTLPGGGFHYARNLVVTARPVLRP
ncbi:MAG: class F sortase [Marmoricola sp.]